MAEKQAAPQSKRVTVTVVSNYGGHRPGAVIEVDEREYLRLREPVRDENGRQKSWRFPVLITAADQQKLDEATRKENAEKLREQQDQEEGGPGWASLEQQSLETVKANWKAAQDRINAGQSPTDKPQ